MEHLQAAAAHLEDYMSHFRVHHDGVRLRQRIALDYHPRTDLERQLRCG
jgi:hypothetical protein